MHLFVYQNGFGRIFTFNSHTINTVTNEKNLKIHNIYFTGVFISMNESETEYFKQCQEVERKKLKELFYRYFRFNRCSNLVLTSENEMSKIDAFMVSGSSHVVAEYKNREFMARKYNDCLLEFNKFEYMYEWFLTGSKCLFIVEYVDYILMWDLNTYYSYHLANDVALDNFFYFMNCPQNGNNRNEVRKLVRNLPYNEATYIIQKSNYHQRIAYRDFIKIG